MITASTPFDIASHLSPQLVRVYRVARDHPGWLSVRELVRAARVAERTAQAHARWFTDLGVFDCVKATPGHRYRLAPTANPGLLQQLEAAQHILTPEEVA